MMDLIIGSLDIGAISSASVVMVVYQMLIFIMNVEADQAV